VLSLSHWSSKDRHETRGEVRSNFGRHALVPLARRPTTACSLSTPRYGRGGPRAQGPRHVSASLRFARVSSAPPRCSWSSSSCAGGGGGPGLAAQLAGALRLDRALAHAAMCRAAAPGFQPPPGSQSLAAACQCLADGRRRGPAVSGLTAGIRAQARKGKGPTRAALLAVGVLDKPWGG
jgi:hypothetical protein